MERREDPLELPSPSTTENYLCEERFSNGSGSPFLGSGQSAQFDSRFIGRSPAIVAAGNISFPRESREPANCAAIPKGCLERSPRPGLGSDSYDEILDEVYSSAGGFRILRSLETYRKAAASPDSRPSRSSADGRPPDSASDRVPNPGREEPGTVPSDTVAPEMTDSVVQPCAYN